MAFFPFNRNALSINPECETSAPAQVPDHSSTLQIAEPLPDSETSISEHTQETSKHAQDETTWDITLFEKRYKEGYNLYDQNYRSWLAIYHPDALPHCQGA